MLREATGKSQREFAEVLGVDHSTVSVYEKPDGRLPDLAYIDGFLAEVASRADVTADVLNDTRDSYGRLLRLLCDQPQERGRTHGYRQMLRVYELTLEREAVTAELADVRQQLQDVAAELARLWEAGTDATADRERQQRLEESASTLEQRRAWLVRRREAVVSDLDAYQAQLRQLHLSDTPPAARPVGGPPQQPPALPLPQRNTPPHIRTRAIVASALVVAVLGGWLIYRMTGYDGGGQTQAPPTPVVVATTVSPTAGSPKPDSDPSPSQTKTATPKSELLTDLHPLDKGGLGGNRYLDVGSGTVDNVSYAYGHALVSHADFDVTGCDGYSEYNLSKQWKNLSMLVGIDDSSQYHTAAITVTLDNKTLFEGPVSIAEPARLALKVTGGLRLHIGFDTTGDRDAYGAGCAVGNIVIGNPTLSR
jgi:transcriptional regulator with XRE-family HTH domain